MPTSTPNLEALPSSPTLDCFTGAIVRREGAGAVGSSYLRDSASSPSAVPGSPSISSATSLSEATSIGDPPPYFARKSPLRSPVFVIRAAPAMRGRAVEHLRSRRQREAVPGPLAIRAKSLRWKLFGAFAVGAALSTLAGLVSDVGSFAVVAFAAAVAGAATLEAWQASCRPRRRRSGR